MKKVLDGKKNNLMKILWMKS